MNKQQALEWLFENVTKWPVKPRCAIITGNWYWIRMFGGEIFAVNVGTDEIITQQDWLDFESNTSEVTP